MNRRAIVAAIGIALLISMTAATATATASTRSTLKGSIPSWASSKNLVRAADPNTVVGIRVYLGWTDRAAAARLARSVSDPRSPSYGKYVTPAQFRRDFAPSQAAVGQVRSWLKSQGFTIDYTPANNHYVAAEGTLAQASQAFGTSFNMYKVNGLIVRSPATSLSIPTILAGTVTAVAGLDESDRFVNLNQQVDRKAVPTSGFRNSPPLSDYWAEKTSLYSYPTGFTDLGAGTGVPWAIRGQTPQSIKGAYNISGYSGAGTTVAVIDAFASPTIRQDVNQWSANRGIPTLTAGQFAQSVPPGIYKRAVNKNMNPRGWYTEETLDVEAVHGMAPGAKILFVGAPNAYRDLDAAINHVVDGRLASIITNSYGYNTELLPPGFVLSVEDTLIQAAAEGIGVYFSSGDFGDETVNFGFATTEWPTSSPWVTAVGGTALAVDADNNRVFETGWGVSSYSCDKTTLACTRTAWTGGSGGGTSRVFGTPWYQANYGLPNTGRHVPDVAAVGDTQTGLLIGMTQLFPDGVYYDEFRVGGTSLSSPIFAGLMAVAQDKCNCTIGFANPAFYESAGQLYDVTAVKTAVARRNFNNSVDASDGTSDFLRTFNDFSGSPTQHTTPGWDNVTGLGSPDGVFTP